MLPSTAAPPPWHAAVDDQDAPDGGGLAPIAPEQLDPGAGTPGAGGRHLARTADAPTGPHAAVPILLYHYVRINPHPADRMGFRLSVTPAAFAAQVALLRADGAHTVSLAEVMRALEGRGTLPSHPVVLTFDDGHDDFATVAAPLLAAEGMTATTFVVTGFLGGHGYMTAAQVREVRALGMTVGAHTVAHADLTRLPTSGARAQIEASRAALQQLTGATIDDFAYPYGRHDPDVDLMVAEAGFRDAVSTAGGDLQYLSRRFALRREAITGADTLWSFAAKAGLPPPRGRTGIEEVPAAPRPRAPAGGGILGLLLLVLPAPPNACSRRR